MQSTKIAAVIAGLVLSVNALAYIPRATEDKYGLFLDSSPYAIPKEFWDNPNSDNRVLKEYTNGKAIESVPSFKNALVTTFGNITYERIDDFNDAKKYLKYPSIYEYRGAEHIPTRNRTHKDPENQCTAFAKMMTHDTTATSRWHAGDKVMDGVSAGSEMHRGKMVAFFRNTKASFKKQDGDVHVGIFLGYGNGGFWIADENFGGTGDMPTGEIRKHFIRTKGKTPSVHNASSYYFINIR